MITQRFRSNNADKFQLRKIAFPPVGIAAMVFDFLKCNNFVISTKIISEHIHGCYFQKVEKAFCKCCAILFTYLVKCGVGKNRQKSKKLIIEPLCYFNKLTGSNGYLYEYDILEYHTSMTTKRDKFRTHNLLIIAQPCKALLCKPRATY